MAFQPAAGAARVIETSLSDYGRFISSLIVNEPTHRLASHVNLAFMAFSVEVMGLPDVGCVERWF